MSGTYNYLLYTLLFSLPLIVFLWTRFFPSIKVHIKKILYSTLAWAILGPILWRIAMSMKAWEYKKTSGIMIFNIFFLEDIVWWFCIGLLFSSFWAISTASEDKKEDFIMKEIKRIEKSFANAFRGLAVIFSEKNLMIHIAISVFVIIAGFFLSFTNQKLTQNEWLWVILWITLVVVFELFNTAIEMLADMHTKDSHPVIGRLKDISAGAVLLVAIGAVITGIIIFTPKIYFLFFQT